MNRKEALIKIAMDATLYGYQMEKDALEQITSGIQRGLNDANATMLDFVTGGPLRRAAKQVSPFKKIRAYPDKIDKTIAGMGQSILPGAPKRV